MTVGYVLFAFLLWGSMAVYFAGYGILEHRGYGQWTGCQVYIISLLCSTLASAVLGTLVLLFSMLYPTKFVMTTIVVGPKTMVWVRIQLLFYHMATFNEPIIVGIVVSVFHIGIKMSSTSHILAALVRKVPLSGYLFMCLTAVIANVGFYIVGWIFIATVVVYMAHQGDVHNPPMPSSGLLAARYALIALLGYTMCDKKCDYS